MNAIIDASWHPKVKKKCEKRGALATANVSFTRAGMTIMCFHMKLDVKALVSAV